VPPLLTPPVADLAGVLSPADHRSIRAAIAALHAEFPQVSICAMFVNIPPGVPAAVYTFWLFNRAQLFSAVEKGGDNLGVLLLIDPSSLKAVVMPGYGLEPFVSEDALRICLETMVRSLRSGNLREAILSALAALGQEMAGISAALPRVFGYRDEAESAGEAADWHDAG
jgi:uncharacterized membrane protein YgcG